MEVFVGHDWAEDHHDVHLEDLEGRKLAAGRLPDGIAGVARFHELVAEHVEDPSGVVIASETDRGLFIGALVAAGYTVLSVNPMSTSRYRERHSTSGAKSDPGDAKVLADLARTDRHNHRPITGDSEQALAVKTLARAHQSLIWTRQRQTNQLRSTLREFYPAALEPFESLHHNDAVAILSIAPDPATGRGLSASKIAAALRRGGRQRNIQQRATQIQTALRSEQLQAPPLVADAMGIVVKSLAVIIGQLNVQIDELETRLADRLEQHPESSEMTRTATSMRSLARTTPGRHRSPEHPASTGSCSPATPATNGWLTRSTNGHSQHSAPAPEPEPSTTNDAPPATATTKPCGPWATGSSASCTAAYDTRASTTNTSPGDTAHNSPLDKLHPWDV